MNPATRSLSGKRTATKSRPVCAVCDDTGRHYVPSKNAVQDCLDESCIRNRAMKRVEKFGLKSKGQIVTQDLIQSLNVSPAVKEISRQDPRSIYLFSEESGTGKSLILKAWANRLMFSGKTFLYFQESTLCREFFFDDAKFRTFFREWSTLKPDFVFIDEFNDPINWRDIDSGRDGAGRKHANYYTFINEGLYDRASEFGVAIASNWEPKETPNTYRHMRRIKEICGEPVRIK